MDNNYCIVARSKKFIFIDGYYCNAQSVNHFLRHISHRFKSHITIYELDNAYKSGDISVVKINVDTSDKISTSDTTPYKRHLEGYLTDFGYVLDLDENNKMSFVSEEEAIEWLESQ